MKLKKFVNKYLTEKEEVVVYRKDAFIQDCYLFRGYANRIPAGLNKARVHKILRIGYRIGVIVK